MADLKQCDQCGAAIPPDQEIVIAGPPGSAEVCGLQCVHDWAQRNLDDAAAAQADVAASAEQGSKTPVPKRKDMFQPDPPPEKEGRP